MEGAGSGGRGWAEGAGPKGRGLVREGEGEGEGEEEGQGEGSGGRGCVEVEGGLGVRWERDWPGGQEVAEREGERQEALCLLQDLIFCPVYPTMFLRPDYYEKGKGKVANIN